MFGEKNLTKIIVNFTVLIFIFIIILIIMLMLCYYLTPNNYSLINFDIEKYQQINQTNYTIKPYSNILLNHNDIKNKLLKFNNDTNLLVKNLFKSQNLYYSENLLLKVNYLSDLIILNDTDKEITIKLTMYK